MSKCDSGPCLNGATCIGNMEGWRCECGYGYTGYLCETGTRKFTVHGIDVIYFYHLINEIIDQRMVLNGPVLGKSCFECDRESLANFTGFGEFLSNPFFSNCKK